MDRALIREFIGSLERLNEKECILSTIAYGAAPTIKGVKPSSLITFTSGGRNLYSLWKKYKDEICLDLRLDFFELRNRSDKCLVLFYNVDMLDDHISKEENRIFLNTMGYSENLLLPQALNMLKHRFESMCPHEIGVFLGIPVRDILEFIRHRGEKCLFCSYWKVYHDPERARSLFQCYDRAKISVIQALINSKTYQRAAV